MGDRTAQRRSYILPTLAWEIGRCAFHGNRVRLLGSQHARVDIRHASLTCALRVPQPPVACACARAVRHGMPSGLNLKFHRRSPQTVLAASYQWYSCSAVVHVANRPLIP